MNKILLLLIALYFSTAACFAESISNSPKLILWAWKRPENLDFINPKTTAVAYLAQTIRIAAKEIKTDSRMESLSVPKGTYLIAVTRIEDIGKARKLDQAEIEQISSLVLATKNQSNVQAIQIDFDAKENQREDYLKIIRKVKDKLENNCPLTITCLASWCLYDHWLDNASVDEGIPMLFSMGQDRQKVLLHLELNRKLSLAQARSSLGLCVDEPDVWPIALKYCQKKNIEPRLYVFSKTKWTALKYQTVEALIEKSLTSNNK